MSDSFSSFDEFQGWVEQAIGQEVFNGGLDRLNKVVGDLVAKLQKKKITIITVAGTNGKGETVHYLKEILKANNKKYFSWMSPHIQSIAERFDSDQGLIKLNELNYYHQKLKKFRGQLTYYEYLLALFIFWVSDKEADYLLLEVGLGGRLDGVNIFAADKAVITSISRDHQEILGSKLKDILKEKYGITRKNGKLFSALESSYLNDYLKKWTKDDQIRWSHLSINPKSTFSRRNYLLASEALAELVVPTFDNLPKRENIGELSGTGIVYYGSHNLDGIRKLVQKLCSKSYNFQKTLLVFSKRKEQDMVSMIRCLETCPYIGEIVLTSFDHEKAYQTKELADKLGKKYCSDFRDLLKEAYAKGEAVLVTGSYYFGGELHRYLNTLR